MVERQGDDAVDTTAQPPSTDLATTLPEHFTIAIDLPAETPTEAPEDELAVAIDDIVIDPAELPPTTRSIRVPPVLTHPELEGGAPAVPVPPLPARPVPKRRVIRGRTEAPLEAETPESAVVDERETAGAPDADETAKPKPPPRPKRDRGPEPEGVLQTAVYRGTFRLVNPGDSLRVRQRKALDARIAALPEGGTGLVPVLSRKGGVGTSTVAAVLGMALADVRDDRVLAIDTHPDRGTLAGRVSPGGRASVRDLVLHARDIQTVNDFAAYVVRDETRLDVVASEHGPTLGLGFDQGDFAVLSEFAERFYGITLVDTGSSTTHSVLRAVLAKAHGLVLVSGGSLDEAEAASQTLDWLESKGYQDLVRGSVVVINAATLGTDVRALQQLRAHFAARTRDVVILPYDPALAAGAVIEYAALDVHTREAARDLAAAVVDGLAPDPAPESGAADPDHPQHTPDESQDPTAR